ncbi:MAG: toll/interleukin-1 receptor domain-containing protein [Methanomicrobiales archaeon]|nr:toll/interleukin-1 receptor domain-containing protein [Methanomicrobiales archaeon]
MKIDLPADLIAKANQYAKAYEKAAADGNAREAKRLAGEVAGLYSLLAWKVPLREQFYREQERTWKEKARAAEAPDFIGDEIPLPEEPDEAARPAPGSMRHAVFISYSKPDMQVAKDICAHLESEGIICWMAPRNVLPGENFPGSIIDAIDASRVVVLVFSKSSDRSPHVIRELTRAVNRDLPIIPFRLEDILPSKNMTYLINIPHWFDAFPPPVQAFFPQLVQTIRALLAESGQDTFGTPGPSFNPATSGTQGIPGPAPRPGTPGKPGSPQSLTIPEVPGPQEPEG